MARVTEHRRKRTHGIQRIDLAYAELASSEIARDINRDVILELIRANQPVSRADLSRLSGLQPSTTSAIVGQLLNEKWIVEGAATPRPRGRRPTLVSLNPGMVIAVASIRPNRAILAVVDLNGRFLSRESLTLLPDPKRSVEKLIAGLQRMIESHPDKSFEGIGLSLPGRVDPVSQILLLAPNLLWSPYNIKYAIERRIPLQVEMDNEANACLLSELWFGRMDGVRNAVLVAISEGIGAAILANGQMVRGQSGLAGEFGHISINPVGPLCSCGQRGCWEMYASSSAAIRYYAELQPDVTRPTLTELLNMADKNDASAIQAFSRQATYLAQGLLIVIATLSPEVILLTGGLTGSWKRFGPIVEGELADLTLAGRPPHIAITPDPELALLRGAAALVLQRHSGYSRSQPIVAKSKSIRIRRNRTIRSPAAQE